MILFRDCYNGSPRDRRQPPSHGYQPRRRQEIQQHNKIPRRHARLKLVWVNPHRPESSPVRAGTDSGK
jgi:hypothetical protein